jgi:hypothetical protein
MKNVMGKKLGAIYDQTEKKQGKIEGTWKFGDILLEWK